ncbi:MAG TPA: Crp/Fnr family transcriptional regulator [Croceibacterium sp.]|nr:Crp/Fnr family transcriptional regulator [Croceibacterium sp.]
MALECHTCPVRDRAACAVLSENEREQLARTGRHRSLKRGEMLFAAGDESAACATLLSGALKVTSVDEQGTERILALVHPAGFVGELFAPFAHHDVVALTDCELCVFPRSEMGRAVEAHPKLAQALLRRSQEELLQSRELLALSGRRSASDKVAGLLLGLAEAASDSSCHAAREFDLPLTRGEIAGMLGLTIETVSRAITKFERDGLIKRKGARGIELVDPARLGQFDEGRVA